MKKIKLRELVEDERTKRNLEKARYSREVISTILFCDPIVEGLPLKVWSGDIKKGEGDWVSNYPIFFKPNVFYKTIDDFIEMFKKMYPTDKVNYTKTFMNIFLSEDILLKNLETIL